MKRPAKPPRKPICAFCQRSEGVQFAIFNPRFPPFGTACVACEATLPPGTQPPCKRCGTPYVDRGGPYLECDCGQKVEA